VPTNEDEDPFYRAAIEVERDEQLAAETSEWDEVVDDGLTTMKAPHAGPTRRLRRLRMPGRDLVVNLDPTRGGEIRKTRPAAHGVRWSSCHSPDDSSPRRCDLGGSFEARLRSFFWRTRPVKNDAAHCICTRLSAWFSLQNRRFFGPIVPFA